MDKHGIKLSSFHLIGKAVETSPDIAREISGRPRSRRTRPGVDNSYQLFARRGETLIATASRPFTSHRRDAGRLERLLDAQLHPHPETLQDPASSIISTSRANDEPFIVPVPDGFRDGALHFHMNDIVSFPFAGWNPAAYEQALRDEFDQLYDEGAQRRRMMVVTCMTASQGHAGRARALDPFLAYAKSKENVWFARKDRSPATCWLTALARRHQSWLAECDRPAWPTLKETSRCPDPLKQARVLVLGGSSGIGLRPRPRPSQPAPT